MQKYVRAAAAATLASAAIVGSLGFGTSTATAAQEPAPSGKTQLIFRYYSENTWGSISKPRQTSQHVTVYYDHVGRTAADVAKSAPYWDVTPTSAGWSTLHLRGECLGADRWGKLQPLACDGSAAQQWQLTAGGQLQRRSDNASFGSANLSVITTSPYQVKIGVGTGTPGSIGGDNGGLQPAAVHVVSPGIGEEITDPNPRFTGTGAPGGDVVVRIDGEIVGGATVDRNGDWAVTSLKTLTSGYHEGTVTQEARGYETTADIRFVIASTGK